MSRGTVSVLVGVLPCTHSMHEAVYKFQLNCTENILRDRQHSLSRVREDFIAEPAYESDLEESGSLNGCGEKQQKVMTWLNDVCSITGPTYAVSFHSHPMRKLKL